jgi:hypothetical protein
MSSNDAKWRHIEDRLNGWAGTLVAGLSQAELRLAWLASRALLRRPTGRPLTAPPLTVESAFEASVQRLRAARGGDELSELAFGRLVREGYLLDRAESLAGFCADLDSATRLEVATLACFAHQQRGQAPRNAVTQALHLAFDRAHHPEAEVREQSARTLVAVLEQVEASPVMRHAVAVFVSDHMRTLDGLLR